MLFLLVCQVPARTRCISSSRDFKCIGRGVNDTVAAVGGTAQGIDVKALFFFHLPYHVRRCTEKVFLGVAVGKVEMSVHFLVFYRYPALLHPPRKASAVPCRCRLSGRGNGRRPGMPVFLPLYPSIQMLYFPVQYSHLRQLLLTHFEWPQSTLYCCRWQPETVSISSALCFFMFPKRFLTLLCPDMSDHPRRSLSSVRLSFPVPLLRKQSRFRLVAFSTSGISAVLESAVQILFCRINGRITCCLTNGTALAPDQEL